MEHLSTRDGTSGGTGRLSEEIGFELLADERRRGVIACLRESAAPVAVSDLARRIAEVDGEGGTDPIDPTTVRVSLYHCHLPKLAAADVVEWNRDRTTVESGANFERVVELFDSLAAPERKSEPP